MNLVKHELTQNENGEYEIWLYVDYMAEFAKDFKEDTQKKESLINEIKSFVKEKYPKIKVTAAKLIISGLIVASVPLATNLNPVSAAVQTAESVYYVVQSGDTLSGIAAKYSSSVSNIKYANNLSSDMIKIGQQLVVPKTIHTVIQGDTLSLLAKKYDVTVNAIKSVNGLSSDVIITGKKLIIPVIFNKMSGQSSYTVVQGDSLWAIANRFGVSISSLKSVNNLTSDVLQIGQRLVIPSEKSVDAGTVTKYTVKSGDTLWDIAKKYGTTVNELRTVNNLDSDTLQIGQTLVIPDGAELPPAAATDYASYTVKSGDSLSKIAADYNTSVSELKRINNLSGDLIKTGQVLKVPKTAVITPDIDSSIVSVQKNLKQLGYLTVSTFSGSYDSSTVSALKTFQEDYGIAVTGKADSFTVKEISHAIVKQKIVSDSTNYLKTPYLWGGTTPSGFDCSGYVYYMFNKHGVGISRLSSSAMYKEGKAIGKADLMPGDLVFYAVNTSGTISHVGIYMGNNEWISATSTKGVAVNTMNNSYWSKYYVGAKRIY